MNTGRASHRLLGLVLVLAWAHREARALAEIQAREYELSWQAETPLTSHRGAWQAPNRTHNLRTYFTEAGIHVVPRLDSSWEWGLELVRYGATTPARRGRPARATRRSTRCRPPELTRAYPSPCLFSPPNSDSPDDGNGGVS